jgi:uncharacterized protein with PIN domain
MNKILEGAKEAVKVAKCDHDLVLLPKSDTTVPDRFDKFYCEKCRATMWVPIQPHYHGRS